jgi:2-keto-4-pentenoate hydratase/2-oxohepta-3-ene-1,7-dioic acid hydratase in catechol pathway
MKLVTIDAQPGLRPGVLLGEDVLDFAVSGDLIALSNWIPNTMPSLLGGGEGGLDIIRRIIDRVEEGHGDIRNRLWQCGALKALRDVRLAAPVPRPGIVLCHGRAYFSHLKEMQKSERPKVEEEPRAFLKNVNAIIGPETPIVLPHQCPNMVDFEGEFSIVFGAPCHNVNEADALATVAGYTIVNDVSARDWAENFIKTGDPDLNRMGKQLPTFCPIGPVIATRDEVPDPHDINLTTTLNGQVMQSAHTADLIWRIPELISYFSRWYPFRPGDILTTGSPAGVGFGRDPKVFMKPGDVVAITVDRVGTLRNPIIA